MKKARFTVEIEIEYPDEPSRPWQLTDPQKMVEERIEMARINDFYGDPYEVRIVSIIDARLTTTGAGSEGK